jgi:hypothetical protein
MANGNKWGEEWLMLNPHAILNYSLYRTKLKHSPFCHQRQRWNNNDFKTAEQLKDLSWFDEYLVEPYAKMMAEDHKAPNSAREVVRCVQNHDTPGAHIFSLHIRLLAQ